MAIAVAETVTGSTDTAASFTLTSWTPGSNNLVLVFVALRDETKTVTVSGNSLTFVEVIDLDNAQGQNGVHVFRAMGASPSTGQITVSISGNTLPVYAAASRFTGIDTGGTNGSAAVEATATNAGEPVTDTANMQISITTVTNNAWAVAAGTHRNSTFTVPGGETAISINNVAGTGGNLTTLSVWYESVATAGATTLGGTSSISGATDWTVAAVSVKPAGGTAYTQGVAGTLTTAGAPAKQTATPRAGTLTSAGAMLAQALKSVGGTLTSAGAVAKDIFVSVAGALTTAGAVTTARTFLQAIEGALTTAGTLSSQAAKVLAGTLTTAGTIAKDITTSVAGTLTSTGTLTKQGYQSLAGTLTTSGSLVRAMARSLAGALTSSGLLATIRQGALIGSIALTLAARGALTVKERTRAFAVTVRNSLTVRSRT